jgi:hypothetical protein
MHKNTGENSLFDTLLKWGSLFDTGQNFLPYLTSSKNFFPYMTLPSILLAKTISFFQLDQNAPPTLKEIDQAISYPCVRACISVHLTHVDPRALCFGWGSITACILCVSVYLYAYEYKWHIPAGYGLKKRDCSSVTYACHCLLETSGCERRCKSARARTPSVRSWSHTHTRSDMHGSVPHTDVPCMDACQDRH